jgi:hypothetical protein
MIYIDQLESVPENSKLYKLYARDKPEGLGGVE